MPIAPDLLRWYDRHARVLPWRERTPDPYRVWLSEIMLQQTTTAAVSPYYARFLARWPDVAALASADDREVMSAWAGLGYYARARNLLACARAVVAAGGRFPDTEQGLRALPGIGPYTAAAITAIAFNTRAVVVDGNVERVVSRLFAIETPLPSSRPEIRACTDAITPNRRPGDFAQAMMDLGATICTPGRPACLLCPLQTHCRAFGAGLQLELPRKSPKAVRPLRFGVAFVARAEGGDLLVRTRPQHGLLGGMTEFPGIWPSAEQVEALQHKPFEANWRLAGQADHGFTHFDLAMQVLNAHHIRQQVAPPGLRWVSPTDLAAEAFPTLMRRVADVAGVGLPAAISDHAPPRERARPAGHELPGTGATEVRPMRRRRR